MNRELLEEKLAELPLYIYDFVDVSALEFSERIRWICQHECPMYGKSWACPRAWARCRSAKQSAGGTVTA